MKIIKNNKYEKYFYEKCTTISYEYEIKNILNNYVKEKYISDIILSYKYEIELSEFNWNNFLDIFSIKLSYEFLEYFKDYINWRHVRILGRKDSMKFIKFLDKNDTRYIWLDTKFLIR